MTVRDAANTVLKAGQPDSVPGRVIVCAFLLGTSLLSAGCTIAYRDDSPEVRYSRDASKAAALQIPPDLTDIGEGEQFVLPGSTGGPVTRDTLLPQFESVRFQRNGTLNWLESEVTPEALWPRLLAFIRSEGMQVAGTEPTAGLIATQWQSAAGDESLFKSLTGGNAYTRVAFRLERTSSGSRLFTRTQRVDKDTATADGADTISWPANSHDLEQTGLILQRLLVFLGLDEQKALGLLDQASAAAVLDQATLEITTGGSRLLVHQGYRPALDTLSATLASLGFTAAPASLPGLLNVTDSAALVDDRRGAYALRVEPVHVGAVKVSVVDVDGNPVDATAARKLLSVLKDSLA